MSDITRISDELDISCEAYRKAKAVVSDLSIQLVQAIAKQYAPTATKVVFEDSDQEGTAYTFAHFADDGGNEVDIVGDENELDNLIWGPVSNLEEDDVLGYSIDVEGAQ